ncbi:flagellar protein FlaG [Paenibacillus sp. MDMC362]|uniref:flagellar protein FlaG n=1 Tax=Paenibacillus sp. MDMC362 TaxID=2977365 RepID=UPI000DC29701|nr:flagellar protein FlaG [Paenibacillus sp. MDMC362]RAR42449.1 flagellar biosynthesis protein FlaG [Paenibacillus sp. MDMC362]
MRIDSFTDKTLPRQGLISSNQNTGGISSQTQSLLDNVPSVSEKRLNDLIEHGNKVLRRLDTRLKWSVHEESRQLVVKVLNTETNEVLREIPPEKYLDLVQNLIDQVGLFLDERK